MQSPTLRFNGVILLVCCLFAFYQHAAHAQNTGVEYNFNWDISTDGQWEVPANWGFSASYPNNTNHNVFIPSNGTYTISISDRIRTNDFTNLNPNATVRLPYREIHYVYGDFHNDGLYIIEDAEIAGSQLILFESDSTLSGSGRIELQDIHDGSSTRIEVRDGFTLTHGSAHTITGIGRIEGSIINHGTIESVVPDKDFIFLSGQSQNTGLLVSTAGLFRIGSGSLLNRSDDESIQGHILADGGDIKLQVITISGGILESRNDSEINLGSPTLIDTTLIGKMTANYDTQTTFGGTITNNAYISVNPEELDTSSTIIWVNQDTTINGNGTIELHDNINGGQAYNGGRIHAISDATLTIGPQQTILGSGYINGSVINAGTINASRDGHELEIFCPSFINEGILKATNNSTLILDLDSSITQQSGRYILADNSVVQLSRTTVTGGSLEFEGSGYFYVEEDSTFDNVILNAPVLVRRQERLNIRNSIINNNMLTVNSDGFGGYTPLTILSDITISGSGTLLLDGAPYTAAIASESGTSTLTNAAGHTIIGGGQINTPLLNHGTLEIGIPAVLSNLNPVRSMTASAPITMGPNGFLKIGVTGTQQSDTLTSTSTFHANGTLEVSYTNDFVPIGYWNHCIITAEHGVTGEFDAVSLPDNTSDPRLTYKVLYMQNEIRVGVYCTADIDNSGHLNFLDISAFLTAFGNQDPAADFTGEGSFNFLDVSAFLSAFGNGCP